MKSIIIYVLRYDLEFWFEGKDGELYYNLAPLHKEKASLSNHLTIALGQFYESSPGDHSSAKFNWTLSCWLFKSGYKAWPWTTVGDVFEESHTPCIKNPVVIFEKRIEWLNIFVPTHHSLFPVACFRSE